MLIRPTKIEIEYVDPHRDSPWVEVLLDHAGMDTLGLVKAPLDQPLATLKAGAEFEFDGNRRVISRIVISDWEVGLRRV